MKDVILYIHGKGGSAAESGHYAPLFPGCEVIGLNYKSFTPWETGREIRDAVEKLCREGKRVTLIANSIGAAFSMSAGIDAMIRRAYFISPIVDLERLIRKMMAWANVTEDELQSRGVIPTAFGEDLSWDYLCYVREHPVSWNAPTEILYGSADGLTDYETVAAFAEAHRAGLTVMDGGEHWFHTPEQMAFLDDWIRRQEAGAEQKILVHGKQYRVLRLLGHGKGGYSYLAECEGRPAVKAAEAETDPGNTASQRVLEKSGFRPMEIMGGEGPRFIKYKEYEMNNDFVIRLERPEDYREVENLVRESFWNVYRPGCSEHYVIHVLRHDPAFVKELDLVMEQEGRLIGQNMFMKTAIEADDGRIVPVLTMGPISITPELKRKGYGKKLLDCSLEKAVGMGFGAVLFEGNIGFYGKSGFTFARNFGVRYHDLPEGADDSFFLCKELIPGYLDGITGVYQTPRGYYVDDADVEAFDRSFPPREKLKLPGQIFG